MKKAICNVSVSPVRSENNDRSEMLTQMLYGEVCDILEIRDSFTFVEICHDRYRGWLDSKQIDIVSQEFLLTRKSHQIKRAFESVFSNDTRILLSMGSEVDHQTDFSPSGNIRNVIVSMAKEFLNVPYLWGGRSFFGVDCSGFTQLIYKANEIKIPRDASQQAEIGQVLGFVEESKLGDLAFFENDEGKIIHVGILLSMQKIIHASGKVRIDDFDAFGIFNREQNKHTHKLRFIRNVLD